MPNCLSVHPAISQRRSSVFPPAQLSPNVCRIPCFALLLPPPLLPSQESRLRSFVRSFVWVCLLAFSPCCHAQGRCTLSPSFSPPVSSPSPQPISWLRQEEGEGRIEGVLFIYTFASPPLRCPREGCRRVFVIKKEESRSPTPSRSHRPTVRTSSEQNTFF